MRDDWSKEFPLLCYIVIKWAFFLPDFPSYSALWKYVVLFITIMQPQGPCAKLAIGSLCWGLLPGRDLDHLTIHNSCFSHSLLRLLRRWGTSGWVLSWPAHTISGSMFSKMLMICWENWTSRMLGMQVMAVKAWLSLDTATWDWNIRDGAKPKVFMLPKRFSFLPGKWIEKYWSVDGKTDLILLISLMTDG